ncbi:MAG: DUF1345 domain-containing protein [Actinomycetota bacterium]|nr:MAG: DUF1345 domain-containing protein [Actinomycetota bacterium]
MIADGHPAVPFGVRFGPRPAASGGGIEVNEMAVAMAARRFPMTTTLYVVIAVLLGLLAGVILLVVDLRTAILGGWTTTSVAFLILTWATLLPMGPAETAGHAQNEDPSRIVRDLVLITVAIVSMITVALFIVAPEPKTPRVLLGIASIAAAWAVVHTVFTLRYARLYFSEPIGGIDFPGDEEPTFRDFAYLSFTVGMTFQVSDTGVSTRTLRATVLRHAMVSFLFGTVIIAVTINLLASLRS